MSVIVQMYIMHVDHYENLCCISLCLCQYFILQMFIILQIYNCTGLFIVKGYTMHVLFIVQSCTVQQFFIVQCCTTVVHCAMLYCTTVFH